MKKYNKERITFRFSRLSGDTLGEDRERMCTHAHGQTDTHVVEAQKANGDVCVARDTHRDSQEKRIARYWFRAAMKRREGKPHEQIAAGARGTRR